MATYIWSGKDNSGREVIEHVTAETPEAAKEQLLRRGWTDLQMRTSEIHDFVRKSMESTSKPEYQANLSAREELKLLKEGSPGFASIWWKGIRESAGTFLLVGACLGLAIYRRQFWGMIICGGALVFLIVLFPVILLWFGQTGDAFRRLHRARNWRRWDDVLECLDGLRKAQKRTRIAIPPSEVARYQALAMAGTGKLQEALDVFKKAAGEAKMAAWLCQCHLASIYIVAEKYDSALECYKQALEVATEKGTVCIDYGLCLVQRFNRPDEARQLLQMAESAPLPDLAKNHLAVLRGVIAFREKDFAQARKHMEEALQGFENQPKSRDYIFEPAVLSAKGYLAVIHAALGNRELAERYFQASGTYLSVTKMDELIADYMARVKPFETAASV